jgi:hypothetical protein
MQKFLVTFSGEPQKTRVVEAKSFLALAMKASRDHWTIEKIEKYVPKMVTRVNLMSGKEYQEPEDTPAYMSPARETYWSR